MGLIAKGVAIDGTETAQDAETAALLSGLGQAQVATADRQGWQEAVVNLTRSFNYYIASEHLHKAVEIAAYHLPVNSGKELIEKALASVPTNSHDAGRLQSRYITPLRSEFDEAQEAFQSALSIAHQESDHALEMRALVDVACVEFTNCHFESSLERNRLAIELAKQVDQAEQEAHAHYDLLHVLLAVGDLDGAAYHADSIVEPAQRSGTTSGQVRAVDANENICRTRGDWQSAREFSDKGLVVSQRDVLLLGCRALIEYQTGDYEVGNGYLDRLMSTVSWDGSTPIVPRAFQPIYTVPAVVLPVTAYIADNDNLLDQAEAIAKSVDTWAFAHPGPLHAAHIGRAFIAILRNDKSSAWALYDSLTSINGVMWPQNPIGPGVSTDRILGLLADTMGEPDRAASHFEVAEDFCRIAGYRPELGWICYEYGGALSSRNAAGDQAKAVSLLEESLAISSELGMRPLMERVLSQRDILKA